MANKKYDARTLAAMDEMLNDLIEQLCDVISDYRAKLDDMIGDNLDEMEKEWAKNEN